MLFVNRETECTWVQSTCSETLATPCHPSLKPLTQRSVGKQLQEHMARVSSEHTGNSMMDRKGEQDERAWMYVSCGPLETRFTTEFKGKRSSLRSETRTFIKSLPEARRRSLGPGLTNSGIDLPPQMKRAPSIPSLEGVLPSLKNWFQEQDILALYTGWKLIQGYSEINHLSSWPEFRRDISARGSFLKSWPGLPGNLKYCCSLFLDLFIWIRLPAWALGDACGLQLVHRWLPFIIIIIINKAPASFRSWWKGETHKKVTTLWGMTTENYKHLSCSEVHKRSTLTKATGRGFLERQAWTRNSRCIWGVKMIERCVRGEAWPAQIHEAKKYKWYLETTSNKQVCHEGKSM